LSRQSFREAAACLRIARRCPADSIAAGRGYRLQAMNSSLRDRREARERSENQWTFARFSKRTFAVKR